MTNIKFTKMQGLGNDFIVIDNTNQRLEINQLPIKSLCSRKTGIGCDQLLIIEKITNLTNEFDYKIFNSSGDEVEHCGNGARCIVKYINEYYNIKNKIVLRTKNRTITGGLEPNSDLIVIDMGIPSFNPDELPFTHKISPNHIYELQFNNTLLQFGVVSVGNPHAIVELHSEPELQDKKSLERIAKTIQNSEYFPNGVNVNFYLLSNENNIQLVTYERSVEFTEACGTGACATAAYGILRGFLINEVKVTMPGGSVIVKWDKTNQLEMIGEASLVFNGEISI